LINRRICFVAPFGLGQKTTVWARTLPLARVLAAYGWQPTILIPPWDTPADAGRTWTESGVTLINVRIDGGVAATTWRLWREIHRIAPGIVHIVKPRAHAGLVQWWLWQQRGRTSPRLLLDADDWEQAWTPVNRYPWPLERVLAWQEEWGIRHVDGVTAASHWLVEHIGQANRRAPILYLPNGIDPPAPDSLRWTPGGGDVLFFSRFVEVSPVWLAAFWRALYAQRPGARLLVAGAPVRPDLAASFRTAMLAAGAAAAGCVTWLGYVDRPQLAMLYPRIGCAIFPAEPTVLQQAKCSVRLATTLLSGVPVVASAVGEQAVYGAEGAANLVPAGARPEEFAATVAAVLATPSAQTTLSATARHRLLAQYNWPALGGRLHAFYKEAGAL
jgi:glycosyltransferase involved in cell wall biosynthesis